MLMITNEQLMAKYFPYEQKQNTLFTELLRAPASYKKARNLNNSVLIDFSSFFTTNFWT